MVAALIARVARGGERSPMSTLSLQTDCYVGLGANPRLRRRLTADGGTGGGGAAVAGSPVGLGSTALMQGALSAAAGPAPAPPVHERLAPSAARGGAAYEPRGA